ncbi:MAG TPA: EamA family transporter [Bryobacteraceae bacterium]|jgi:drug/metabolite transporter (DMT)-like permease|nr:EamA family transporter [Bryobacteraceae bacterium]
MTKTPLISIALVLFASVIGSFGAVFLKLGAERLRYGMRHILNLRLAFGIFLFLASSIPFLMGIKRGELSVLYPMVSFSYVLTLFWSKLFFGEPITKGKVSAITVILFGLICIGLGAQ